MNVATPLWVVVLVGAIGVAGTLLAALLAASTTTRREAARAREQVDREYDRAREDTERMEERLAEREQRDAARAEADRRTAARQNAYTEFLLLASRWERYISDKRDHRLARNGAAVPIDTASFADPVDRAFATVQILGRPEVLDSATKAYHNLVVTAVHLEASHFSVGRVDEGRELVREHLAQFLAAVRDDLDIDPATPLTA